MVLSAEEALDWTGFWLDNDMSYFVKLEEQNDA
jgi:hypothetical protein